MFPVKAKGLVHLCEYDGVKLEFEEEALQAIAEKAIKRGTGARGLRAIIEGIMGDVMYEIPSEPSISRIIVTKEAVEDSKSVLVEREDTNDIKSTGTEG